MGEMIQLRQVGLQFGSGFALKQLSFTVEEGEAFGFLGPSGAGKTTTIKLLTRQLKKDSGEIHILGKSIEEVERRDYEQIGIMTDTSGLYERMTMEENLRFFCRLHNVPEERAGEMLKRLRMYDERKTLIKKCSRGMRQRVALAAVLVHRPRLLFLDEPTSALDPATAREVHRLLEEMKAEGATIFLTTHNMEEADRLCDRVGILNQGSLVAEGSPQELKLRYAQDRIRILTTDGEYREVKKDAQGAQVLKELLETGRLQTVHSEEPNLEEIFLLLTGREFE